MIKYQCGDNLRRAAVQLALSQMPMLYCVYMMNGTKHGQLHLKLYPFLREVIQCIFHVQSYQVFSSVLSLEIE